MALEREPAEIIQGGQRKYSIHEFETKAMLAALERGDVRAVRAIGLLSLLDSNQQVSGVTSAKDVTEDVT